MKAFIAVLLVAAVSGQMTIGGDRTVMDLLRTRQQLYNRGVQGIPTLYNKFVNQQEQQTGVYGDLTTIGQILPSTQQYNIPSEYYQTLNTNTLYTLRQLYTLPIFQEYMTLPLFRQYLTVPVFQQYLTSQYFQQYFTQVQTFRQFFVEPTLFYKYIFPVVIQIQQQLGLTGFQQQLVVPEIYVKYVPEVFRGLYTVAPTVYPTGLVGNQIYNREGLTYNTVFGDNTIFGKRVVPNTYNYVNTNTYGYKNVVPEMYTNTYGYNKNIVPEIYNTNTYGYKNVIPEVYNKEFFPQTYGYGKTVFGQKNIFDVLNGGRFNTVPVYGEKMATLPIGYENTIRTTVPLTMNTNTVLPKEVLLEKIFKDLVEGKINIEDLKVNNEFVSQKYNKIVDPITGDYKVVEDKVMKPVLETIVDGELTKDAMLNKVILKKQIFNKL